MNGSLVPGEHRRVSTEPWRGILEEWESRDPTTEVPLAKRIIDMFGDTTENFLDSYPIPDNLHRAGRVNHILRSPIRPPYPEIGEEEVISNHVIDGGHLALVFEDGSTMEDGRTYGPGHPKSKRIINKILSYHREQGNSSKVTEDELYTLRAMASQNKVPRPPVQFWEGLVNTETRPQVVEAVSELKNQQEVDRNLRVRGKKLEQSSGLDQTSHYVPRRGRGQRNIGR